MSESQYKALVDALAAFGIKLQPIPVTPPVVQPTGFQESADRASVLVGSSGVIIDATGAKWTIPADGTVQRNGVHATNSANATLIYYFNHKLYHRNQQGNWYFWENDGWTQTTTPGVVPPVSTPPIIVPPVVGSSTPAKAFLAFLDSIKGKHAISGQFVERGFMDPLTAIQNNTGKFPAIAGFDCYYFNAPLSFRADGSWAQKAIDHLNKGGLATLSLAMPNPASGGGLVDLTSMNFDDLVKQGTPLNSVLNGILDDVAKPLIAVKNACPTKAFMFRPWHEHDGNWFWYGRQNCNDAQFRALWAYTYAYMTNVKGLTNIVWLNGQNAGSATVNRTVPLLTDMYGIDGYTSNPAQLSGDFAKFASLGKPLMLSEFGSGDPSKGDTNFQLTTLIDALKGPLNNVVAWLNWWDGNSQAGWGMAEEQNVKAALQDPYVLNRGDINY